MSDSSYATNTMWVDFSGSFPCFTCTSMVLIGFQPLPKTICPQPSWSSLNGCAAACRARLFWATALKTMRRSWRRRSEACCRASPAIKQVKKVGNWMDIWFKAGLLLLWFDMICFYFAAWKLDEIFTQFIFCLLELITWVWKNNSFMNITKYFAG